MLSIEEVLKGAKDFREKVNDNKKVRKLLKRWNPVIYFETKDSDIRITLDMSGGQISAVEEGHVGEPDLVVLFPTTENLSDMFYGRLDPTPMYLSGDILVKGHQADVIKLDAITMIIWPEEED
ncbi:SCP2 sterol-binding domain-containing protein [bacterium]|nr:SCP2 sterol-binding domain-containing protein [bacterium]